MSGSLKVPGFCASGVAAGIKKKKQSKAGYDELDLGLIVSDVPAIVAGVFTEN